MPDKKYAPAINAVEVKYNKETSEWVHPDLWSLWNKWREYGSNIFCPSKNLLITLIDASRNNGIAIKPKAMLIFKFWELRRQSTNTEPKKVLPVSPINNLAGCQFKIKNPIKDPNKTK